MKRLLFILPLLCLSAWGQQSQVGVKNPFIVQVYTNGTAIGPNGSINTAGTTTAGIQEAINALPQTNTVQADATASAWNGSAGGGEIHLQQGTYVVSGQLLVPDNGPFFLTLEGVGKGGSVIKYTGTTNCFQNVGTNTLYGYSPLNLIMRSIGFTYVADTSSNMALLHLNLNSAYFENCLFATWQQFSTNGVGASLIHLPYTLSHRVGTIGIQMDAANVTVFENCEFDGLAYGLVPLSQGIDQLRMRDCIWENIRTNYSIYPANKTFTGFNAWSSCCLLALGSNTELEDCHFMSSSLPLVSAGTTYNIRPRFEGNGATLWTSVVSPGGYIVVEDWFEDATHDGDIAANGSIVLEGAGAIYNFKTLNGFTVATGGSNVLSLTQSAMTVPGTFIGSIPVTNVTAIIPGSSNTNIFYMTLFGTVVPIDGGGGTVNLSSSGAMSGTYQYVNGAYAGPFGFGMFLSLSTGWTLTNSAHPNGIVQNPTGTPITDCLTNWNDNVDLVAGLITFATNNTPTNVFSINAPAVGVLPTIIFNVSVAANGVLFTNLAGPSTQTNWVSGLLYTNTSSSDWYVRALGTWTTAAATGGAEIDLQVGSQGGALSRLSGAGALTGALTLVQSYTNEIGGYINAGRVFAFTNVSAGAGNVSGLVTGTGQKKQF